MHVGVSPGKGLGCSIFQAFGVGWAVLSSPRAALEPKLPRGERTDSFNLFLKHLICFHETKTQKSSEGHMGSRSLWWDLRSVLRAAAPPEPRLPCSPRPSCHRSAEVPMA